MKIRFRYAIYIGFMISSLCLGCAGVERHYNDFQTALKETRTAFLEKINANEPETEDTASVSAENEQSHQAEPNVVSGCRDGCYEHTVRWPGESLSLIAKWYTGSFMNWKKLAGANPGINPDLIKANDVILIPSDLVKTREPLPQKVAARYTPNFFAHVVKHDGEEIKDIAHWYTGDSANWKLLAKANPKLNPEKLVAGNEIFIPENLLKTRKAVPFSTPSSSTPKTEPKPPIADSEKAPAGEQEIKLFGPKQFPRS